MASIIKRPKGHRWIQFVDRNGRRQSLRLGKCNQRDAEAIKVKVQDLVAASVSGASVRNETAAWLAEIGDTLRGKLVKLRLITDVASEDAIGGVNKQVAVQSFVHDFIEKRRSIKKPNTIRNYEQAKNDLNDFFGVERSLDAVTTADVDDFRLWMQGRGLATNTINRQMGRCKQFWLAAIKAKLISENPFAEQDCQVRPVEERFVYVEESTIEKVISAAVDAEWRLIIALARYGGLRCPSEVLSLKWSDINWAEHKMLVTAPKTAHHEGKATRWAPLFEKLRLYLEEAFELAQEGAEFVIMRYRNKNSNLRTQLERICKAAGVDMWQKPFQNLRSSAEIDLNKEFPQHVVARWLGHSENIAFQHYLRTTDSDFMRAAGVAPKSEAECEAVDDEDKAKAKQNPKQHSAAKTSTSSQDDAKTPQNTAFLSFDADSCGLLQCTKIPPRGVEPLSSD